MRGELQERKVDAPEKVEKIKLPRREVRIPKQVHSLHLVAWSVCLSDAYTVQSTVDSVQDTSFHTSIGRGVFDAIFNPPKLNVSEQFLPKRTAFVYELDNDGVNPDIPTTLRRSKTDCPLVSRRQTLCPV